MFSCIDDFCKYQSVKSKKGPRSKMIDSEIITIALFCELIGKTSECEQVDFTKEWLKSYFPNMIDRSRYSRRVKYLMRSINDVRQKVLNEFTNMIRDIHVIDSTPIPVMRFSRAHFTPLFPEAGFGYCAAKRMTYYGFKLHLVVDSSGIPLHFDLTPANIADNQMTEELLAVSTRGQLAIGDKGYISETHRLELKQKFNINLITPRRNNQIIRETNSTRKAISKFRQIIEVVNGILKKKFSLEKVHAKTLKGLAVKVLSKITAYTFGIYLNMIHNINILKMSSFN
jgi:hypothetical protein